MRTTLGLPWPSCGARFPGPHLQATARALGCPFHLSWPHLLLVSATTACSSLAFLGHKEAAQPPGLSLGRAFSPCGYNTSALGKGRWGEGTLPHHPAPSSLNQPKRLPGERRNAQGPFRASSSNPPTNLRMRSVPSSLPHSILPPYVCGEDSPQTPSQLSILSAPQAPSRSRCFLPTMPARCGPVAPASTPLASPPACPWNSPLMPGMLVRVCSPSRSW